MLFLILLWFSLKSSQDYLPHPLKIRIRILWGSHQNSLSGTISIFLSGSSQDLHENLQNLHQIFINIILEFLWVWSESLQVFHRIFHYFQQNPSWIVIRTLPGFASETSQDSRQGHSWTLARIVAQSLILLHKMCWNYSVLYSLANTRSSAFFNNFQRSKITSWKVRRWNQSAAFNGDENCTAS